MVCNSNWIFIWQKIMGHCDSGQLKFTMLAKWVFLYVVEATKSLPGVLYLKEEECISQEKNPVKFYVLYIDSLSSWHI